MSAAGNSIGASMAAASKRLTDTIGMQESAWVSSIKRAHVVLSTAPKGNDTFEVGYRLFPGETCRGDFCDVFHLDDQKTLVLLVDSGGQGHVGMAQAMAIRGAFLNATKVNPDDISLAETYNALNEMMAGHMGRQLVASMAALCDLSAGKITYINAGSPPPIVMVGPGRLVTMDQPSLLLGIDNEYLYEETAVEIPSKFRLVCCTNGMCNTVNSSNEMFGDRRLHDLLLENEAFVSAQEIVEKLSEAFTSHLSEKRSGKRCNYRGDQQILIFGKYKGL